MTMINAVGRSSHVPADVRLANLARIVEELRHAGALSRSEVARRVQVSLPTAHRLVSDLAELQLVEEEEPEADNSRLGRPPVVYRFRDDVGLLAGIDVGNETTRLSVTTLAGRVITAQAVTSDRLGADLSGALVARITEMVSDGGARVTVDAGSKTLTTTAEPVYGHGHLLGRPDATVTRLSEEHGVLTAAGTPLAVGDQVRILPVHVCVWSDLQPEIYGIRHGQIVERIRVDAFRHSL